MQMHRVLAVFDQRGQAIYQQSTGETVIRVRDVEKIIVLDPSGNVIFQLVK